MTEEQNNDQDNQNQNMDGQDNMDGQNQDQNSEDQNSDSQDNNNDDDREPESFNYDLILDEIESDDDADSDDNEGKKKSPKRSKAVEAINDMKLSTAISNEVSRYFEKHPEAKEFRKTVDKFVSSPERVKHMKNGLPVSAVIAEALAPHQQRIGALKAKKAQEEADRTKDGGGSTKPSDPGKTDYSKMSSSDIRKMARDVKNGRYSK